MGRPASDLDDYLDWQEWLENYRASGLEIEVFCLQEGVSRTTFYKWAGRLKDCIPESMIAEKAARERAESGEAVFVPISFKASPVVIELPNGGSVRLPLVSASPCWWKSSELWTRLCPTERTTSPSFSRFASAVPRASMPLRRCVSIPSRP